MKSVLTRQVVSLEGGNIEVFFIILMHFKSVLTRGMWEWPYKRGTTVVIK
jgi:hypothetical protein